MSMWDVFGLLFIIFGGLALLIMITFFTITYVMFVQDKLRKRKALKEPPQPKLHEWNDSISAGDYVKVGLQEFKVVEVWSDFDIDYNRYKFRIDLESDRDSASKITILDS